MKRTHLLITAFCFGLIINMNAQDEKPDYGIKFSGFVKNDFIFDTRQTESAREGHFLLFPANEDLDDDGEDINARSSFNYLSIQSRLTGTISGPDAFGAKTSGILEGAFFGMQESDINGFRLRHAFVKLNWTNTELLMGQFWHMMFVTDCFPGTISFNTGVPFQYFSRNPQIRITQKAGNLSFSGMVATQRDFSSPGGPSVLRNALLPDLQGQIAYKGTNFLAGISAGYKQLLPRLKTESDYKTTSSVKGFTGQAFLKISTNPINYKFQATYLQNGYDGMSLGGFAIKTISDSVRDYREYTSINTMSFWTDIETKGKIWQFGVFAGYSKNLGASEEVDDVLRIADDKTTRGLNIGYLYRVSPRIIVNSGKTRFALELEHTAAAYGSSINNMAIPQDLKILVNNRILVAAYYFF